MIFHENISSETFLVLVRLITENYILKRLFDFKFKSGYK